MSDAGDEYTAIIARIYAVEKLTGIHASKLLNILRRLAAVEKKSDLNEATLVEIKRVAKVDSELRAANAEKLDTLLAFTNHARSIGGFARRHGPRVVAFAVGVAITKGWLGADLGQHILHLFGL